MKNLGMSKLANEGIIRAFGMNENEYDTNKISNLNELKGTVIMQYPNQNFSEKDVKELFNECKERINDENDSKTNIVIYAKDNIYVFENVKKDSNDTEMNTFRNDEFGNRFVITKFGEVGDGYTVKVRQTKSVDNFGYEHYYKTIENTETNEVINLIVTPNASFGNPIWESNSYIEYAKTEHRDSNGNFEVTLYNSNGFKIYEKTNHFEEKFLRNTSGKEIMYENSNGVKYLDGNIDITNIKDKSDPRVIEFDSRMKQWESEEKDCVAELMKDENTRDSIEYDNDFIDDIE